MAAKAIKGYFQKTLLKGLSFCPISEGKTNKKKMSKIDFKNQAGFATLKAKAYYKKLKEGDTIPEGKALGDKTSEVAGVMYAGDLKIGEKTYYVTGFKLKEPTLIINETEFYGLSLNAYPKEG